jgi:hypothetical protein
MTVAAKMTAAAPREEGSGRHGKPWHHGFRARFGILARYGCRPFYAGMSTAECPGGQRLRPAYRKVRITSKRRQRVGAHSRGRSPRLSKADHTRNHPPVPSKASPLPRTSPSNNPCTARVAFLVAPRSVDTDSAQFAVAPRTSRGLLLVSAGCWLAKCTCASSTAAEVPARWSRGIRRHRARK